MGDMGEEFNALALHRQKQRTARRESAQEWVVRMGIPFVMHSDAHYRLTIGGKTVDYWPGTARWRVAGESKARFTRPRLEAFINQHQTPPLRVF